MRIDKKRRREYKTNYKKRLTLLKSGVPRLVIRKTNRYITLQVIESKNAQDRVKYGVSTKELLEYGWPQNKKGSLKSLGASYLAGYLLGEKSKNIKKIVLDIGLLPSTKGSRIYAAVKGFADAGAIINYDKKIMPDEERIKKGIDLFEKIKSEISKK